MNFNVAAMGKHVSPYEKAVKEQRRRKTEKTLGCDYCGTQNRPGNVVIDIDDHDDAHCGTCGAIFQVRVDDDGDGI